MVNLDSTHSGKANFVSLKQNVFVNNFDADQNRFNKWVYDYERQEQLNEIIPKKIRHAKYIPIFRYSEYRYLKYDLKKDILSFSNPMEWNDPFEKFFYLPDGVVAGGKKYYVACICFTYDPIESEEASWNRYSSSNMVRVEYSFEKLCQELSRFNKYRFYFGIADYSFSKREICRYKTQVHQKGYQSIDEYLTCMCLKRKAFCYENEMRLFIVSETPFDFVYGSFPLQGVDIKSTICSICLSPNGADGRLKGANDGKKKIADELGIGNVKRSRLYGI